MAEYGAEHRRHLDEDESFAYAPALSAAERYPGVASGRPAQEALGPKGARLVVPLFRVVYQAGHRSHRDSCWQKVSGEFDRLGQLAASGEQRWALT